MDELHFSHVPVLLDACLEGLNIRPDGQVTVDMGPPRGIRAPSQSVWTAGG